MGRPPPRVPHEDISTRGHGDRARDRSAVRTAWMPARDHGDHRARTTETDRIHTIGGTPSDLTAEPPRSRPTGHSCSNRTPPLSRATSPPHDRASPIDKPDTKPPKATSRRDGRACPAGKPGTWPPGATSRQSGRTSPSAKRTPSPQNDQLEGHPTPPLRGNPDIEPSKATSRQRGRHFRAGEADAEHAGATGRQRARSI